MLSQLTKLHLFNLHIAKRVSDKFSQVHLLSTTRLNCEPFFFIEQAFLYSRAILLNRAVSYGFET